MILEPQNVPPPPAPAIPTIPLTVASLVSRSFTIWTHNLWPLLGFTLLVWIPATVALVVVNVALVDALPQDAEADLWTQAPALAGGWLALNLLAHLGCWSGWAAGITHVTLQTLTVGAPPFGAVLGVAARRALPALGSVALAAALVALGTTLLLVPGVILACGLALVVGPSVCERLGPIRALRRSWRLTAGHRATMLWTLLVVALLQLGITVGSMVLIAIPLLGILLFLFVALLTSPLGVIWSAVAYHDLRVRKEGAATDELARVFE